MRLYASSHIELLNERIVRYAHKMRSAVWIKNSSFDEEMTRDEETSKRRFVAASGPSVAAASNAAQVEGAMNNAKSMQAAQHDGGLTMNLDDRTITALPADGLRNASLIRRRLFH